MAVICSLSQHYLKFFIVRKDVKMSILFVLVQHMDTKRIYYLALMVYIISRGNFIENAIM